MTRVTRIISLAAVLASAGAPLAAQSVGAAQQGRYGIGLEAMRPQTKDPGSSDINGATVFLSGHAELRPAARLQLEIPFVFSKATEGGISESSSSIGNPYVGVQLHKNWVTFDVGGRAPLASSEEAATLLGLVTDLDRFEAFIADAASVIAVGRAEAITSTGFAVAGFGGPSYVIYTGDESDVDNELMLIYGVEASYRTGFVHAGARLSARYITTEDGSFGEKSLHQVGLFANLGRGSIRPSFQFRIPVDDDLREQTKWSGGMGLQIELGKR
jgi:hypothetical protein